LIGELEHELAGLEFSEVHQALPLLCRLDHEQLLHSAFLDEVLVQLLDCLQVVVDIGNREKHYTGQSQSLSAGLLVFLFDLGKMAARIQLISLLY
jgi:hypothetical protein